MDFPFCGSVNMLSITVCQCLYYYYYYYIPIYKRLWHVECPDCSSLCALLLFTRWSWRGSVGEAEVERWLWTTSPWGKAPAQRSTIWGDSNWEIRQKANEGESSQREVTLLWQPLTLPGHSLTPTPPTTTSLSHHADSIKKNNATAEQWAFMNRMNVI